MAPGAPSHLNRRGSSELLRPSDAWDRVPVGRRKGRAGFPGRAAMIGGAACDRKAHISMPVFAATVFGPLIACAPCLVQRSFLVQFSSIQVSHPNPILGDSASPTPRPPFPASLQLGPNHGRTQPRFVRTSAAHFSSTGLRQPGNEQGRTEPECARAPRKSTHFVEPAKSAKSRRTQPKLGRGQHYFGRAHPQLGKVLSKSALFRRA